MKVLTTLALLLAISPLTAMSEALKIVPGDILVQQSTDGLWHAVRILEVDRLADGSSTAHSLIYEPSRSKPDAAAARALPVRIWHGPIDGSSFEQGWERLGNQPIAPAELKGFIEYLKQTDFMRYVAVTGQDAHEVTARANRHYAAANALAEQGKRSEAIDNRAFMYMELGRFEDALRDFDQSLRVNSDGVTAFFSRGECLMKLGRLSEAEAVFEEGSGRFPEQRDLFSKFLNQVRSTRRKN